MASGIFAVLDDISALMDDVASMSKIATKKTAGILGDDLAVNTEKATGFCSRPVEGKRSFSVSQKQSGYHMVVRHNALHQ